MIKYRCRNCGRIFNTLNESIDAGKCCEKKDIIFYREKKGPEATMTVKGWMPK